MARFDLEDLPYERDALDGISEQVVTWHHGTHQQGYVDGLNGYLERIQEMRETGDFDGIGAVKSGLTHNGCGMYLHEVYWGNMGGDGGRPSGELLDALEETFGDFDTFRQEFTAVAKAAGGWALLVYWPRGDMFDVVMVDKHDRGALWGAEPILAVDVWEHAYYYDQGPDRGSYLDAFWDNIDWDAVAERFRQVS
ncbi:MAG: superoxide dismutase [Candidatus Nanohaloarchaea archaeon]|nr:superoxide dismutase [Candidatus Nanohaloarchaea archaeon]